MAEYLCLGLMAVIGFQQWTHWRESHRLIDKIMSKNYPEYVSSVSYLKPKASSPGLETPDPEAIQESEVLNEVNSYLGPRF